MNLFPGKKETEGKRHGLDPISCFICGIAGKTETWWSMGLAQCPVINGTVGSYNLIHPKNDH